MIEDCGLWPDKPVYGASFLRTKVAKNIITLSAKMDYDTADSDATVLTMLTQS